MCPATPPLTPDAQLLLPEGPPRTGGTSLKEMSGAPEKVLRNLSPRTSWLWGVIKACLQGLFLALKDLVVLPGLRGLPLSKVPLIVVACPPLWGQILKGLGKQKMDQEPEAIGRCPWAACGALPWGSLLGSLSPAG